MMPGRRRSASTTSAATGSDGAINITAVPGSVARPTSMSAMLTPASPSSVPTDADHAGPVVVA